MKQKINKLVKYLVSDIEEMRNSDMRASERVGAEVMLQMLWDIAIQEKQF